MNLKEEKDAINNIAMNEWKEIKKDFVETTDRIKDFCEYKMNEWVVTPENEDSSKIDKVGSTAKLIKESSGNDIEIDGKTYYVEYEVNYHASKYYPASMSGPEEGGEPEIDDIELIKVEEYVEGTNKTVPITATPELEEKLYDEIALNPGWWISEGEPEPDGDAENDRRWDREQDKNFRDDDEENINETK